MTQVLAKTTAITKAIQNKLVKCFLHPTKSSANNATNKSVSPLLRALFGSAILTARIHTPSLLLPLCQDNSTITTATHAQNLLLPSVQDDPAIRMRNHTNSKLQLIVEYLLLPRNFECPAISMTVNTRNLLPFFVQNDPANTIASSLQLIVESLFLLRYEDNSETMAPSLLLFCVRLQQM